MKSAISERSHSESARDKFGRGTHDAFQKVNWRTWSSFGLSFSRAQDLKKWTKTKKEHHCLHREPQTILGIKLAVLAMCISRSAIFRSAALLSAPRGNAPRAPAKAPTPAAQMASDEREYFPEKTRDSASVEPAASAPPKTALPLTAEARCRRAFLIGKDTLEKSRPAAAPAAPVGSKT